MAEMLLRPVRQPVATVVEAGFDEAFVGFTGAQPPPATEPAPPTPDSVTRAARQTTREPSPVSAPAPAPLDHPPVAEGEASSGASSGPFLERIQRFHAWLEAGFGAAGTFILDRHGAVLFDAGGFSHLQFMARSLAKTSNATSGHAHNVHVKVGGQAVLEVIPVETPYGRLVISLVVPAALPADGVDRIRGALVAAATPPVG